MPSVYYKPTFTGQYCNFNFLHPYSVKKEIIHWNKFMSWSRQKMISIKKKNLQGNNYPVSTTRGDRRVEDNNNNLLQTYLQDLYEVHMKRIKGSAVHTSGQCSKAFQPFWDNPPEPKLRWKKKTTNNCMHFIPCSCGREYKGKTSHPLKIRVEVQQNVIVWEESLKSGMSYMERKGCSSTPVELN